jgi:hypothetical protein
MSMILPAATWQATCPANVVDVEGRLRGKGDALSNCRGITSGDRCERAMLGTWPIQRRPYQDFSARMDDRCHICRWEVYKAVASSHLHDRLFDAVLPSEPYDGFIQDFLRSLRVMSIGYAARRMRYDDTGGSLKSQVSAKSLILRVGFGGRVTLCRTAGELPVDIPGIFDRMRLVLLGPSPFAEHTSVGCGRDSTDGLGAAGLTWSCH